MVDRLDVHPHTGDRQNFSVFWFLPYNYQASCRGRCKGCFYMWRVLLTGMRHACPGASQRPSAHNLAAFLLVLPSGVAHPRFSAQLLPSSWQNEPPQPSHPGLWIYRNPNATMFVRMFSVSTH
jgi:hypothetical protein